MEQGIILKGTGGFYEVLTRSGEKVTCRLRGRLRLEDDRVLVGDRVEITSSSGEGVVEQVLPRSNSLLRPPIANVDQVLVVVAAAKPDPVFLLLDRILVHAELSGLNAVVVVNKSELNQAMTDEIIAVYTKAGYPTVAASAKTGQGLDELKEHLKDKVSTLAGPSGVGKSSLVNAIEPGLSLETGDVSAKLRRGRHTTRSVSLLPLSFGGIIADTPGFSRLEMVDIDLDTLPHLFPEFEHYLGECQFRGCFHRHEPNCRVKEAVEANEIAKTRYDHYLVFLREIEESQPY